MVFREIAYYIEHNITSKNRELTLYLLINQTKIKYGIKFYFKYCQLFNSLILGDEYDS